MVVRLWTVLRRIKRVWLLMLGPDSGIGSVRVVVARRAVSLLSNRIFGAWITWTRNLCCGTISRLWTKNSLIGFSSGEWPLTVVRCDETPQYRPPNNRGPFRANSNFKMNAHPWGSTRPQNRRLKDKWLA